MVTSNIAESIDISSLYYSDLLAILCHYIYNLQPTEKKSLHKFASVKFSDFVELAMNQFPDLRSPFKEKRVNPDQFSCIPDLILSQSQEDKALLLGVIGSIDTMLDIGISESPPLFLQAKKCPQIDDLYGERSNSWYKCNALNKITNKQYGTLLPKLHCAWSKKTNRTIQSVGLDPLSFALLNFYWIPSGYSWDVTHLFCDFYGCGFNSKNIDPNLKILSTPLDFQAPFLAVEDSDGQTFNIQYVTENDARLKARMKKIISQAVQREADIVLFPEMMGTPESIQYCKNCVSKNIDDLFAHSRPKLILLPTREYQAKGKWINELDILDEEGKIIFRYHKQHPYYFDMKTVGENGKMVKRLYEPIGTDGDGKLCVIHIPGIGRIGVVICADIFAPGYLEHLVKHLKITLLLWPVFSFGIDSMQRALGPALTYSCDVVLCNTCAAWDETFEPLENRPKNIGFNKEFINVYYPYGHKEKNIAKGCTVNTNCSSDSCSGCVFLTEVPNTYDGVPTAPTQFRLEEN